MNLRAIIFSVFVLVTATVAQDEAIRCESAADCPADLPTCCGFDPRIKYCLPEGVVC